MPSIEEPPLAAGVTVLVAEDDPFVRSYAVSTLEASAIASSRRSTGATR